MKKKMIQHAHAISIEQVRFGLRVDLSHGLSVAEILKRRAGAGFNEVPEKRTDSWLVIFLRQFQSPLIYILLIAAAVIFFVGPDQLDAFLVSGILIFNALIGAVQEGRSQHILENLRQFITADCMVLRDGQKQVIRDRFLVPGDIVVLYEGQRVPADLRLFSVQHLLIDEALLTGESGGIEKQIDPVRLDAAVADRTNMVFKGTYVLSGSGMGIVVATGDQTEVGRLHQEATGIQQETPLKKELDWLSVWILVFVLSVCLGLLIAGLILGKPLRELLVMLTALFVCVIPEGLPLVLTLVLVTGMYRMAKHQVLVKKMQAVEALGRTNVIVIDKTGTLTLNEMMVVSVVVHGHMFGVTGRGYERAGQVTVNENIMADFNAYPALTVCAQGCALLSHADITKDPLTGIFVVRGDPTEAALSVLAGKVGISVQDTRVQFQELYVFAFDPRLKFRAAFYRHDDQLHLFVLGAPETIIQWTTVGPNDKRLLQDMLDRGLRVLGCAHITLSMEHWMFEGNGSVKKYQALFDESCARGLQFVGFCGIQDAIRANVSAVIDQVRHAGLRVIMATGDHEKTAMHVARQVGIFREGDQALSGSELARLSEEEFLQRCLHVTVYSRVSPTNKLRLIRTLHAQQNIVAMTGDGANDVPSLLAADVGIAMGRMGTEVAKEVADMVLLDDSFVSIVKAIELGRHILYTLRRVVLYFFATNFGEILIILFAMMVAFFHVGFPLPLNAVHILWLNLVTDGFLDTALAMEQQEEGLLQTNWLRRKPHLVDSSLFFESLFMAAPMAIGSLVIFGYYHEESLVYAQSMTLTAMAVFQWFNAWNCRSECRSICQVGLFSNRWLVGATMLVAGLQLMLLNIPFMQRIFKTTALSLVDWLLILAIASSIIILEEARKLFMRRRDHDLFS